MKGPIPSTMLCAEKVIKWCLLGRNRLIKNFHKKRLAVQRMCEVILTRHSACTTTEEKSEAIFGILKHTPSTETFFLGCSLSVFFTITYCPSPKSR